MEQTRLSRYLILAHGGYLCIGGLWPLIHMDSFEAVTGPKVDEFLVRSIALILLLTAAVLFSQLHGKELELSAVIMGMGISLILGSIAIISAALGYIRAVYFLDGALHVLFGIGWLSFLIRNWRARRRMQEGRSKHG